MTVRTITTDGLYKTYSDDGLMLIDENGYLCSESYTPIETKPGKFTESDIPIPDTSLKAITTFRSKYERTEDLGEGGSD